MYGKFSSLFLSWTYYRLKPVIPWGVRMAVRRWLARRIRASCTEYWPILEAAGDKPGNFPGWPDGKRFAFVLTHDVESRVGLQRCRKLVELDAAHGFKGSFNFIPEGQYDSSQEREWLKAKGLEVGVHDLRHDGKLYDSRVLFSQGAKKINQYLREWRAVGFRSAFMHNNLDWLQELQITYDMSTFDTDPFEPLPDGVHTIFPFWCGAEKGRAGGYVELPYTLPQDSTMFLVLEEKSTDIWRRKLDWIAQRGGMALLNVHPDYVCFEGSGRRNEYPVVMYREFLEYVRATYEGQYWHALPREVANYVKPAVSRSAVAV